MGLVLRDVIVLVRAPTVGKPKTGFEIKKGGKTLDMRDSIVLTLTPADFDRAVHVATARLRKGERRARFYIGRRGRK